MLGVKGRDFHPIAAITLDDLVLDNHFYRHLEQSLDLAFVRDFVADYCAPIGRPSIDPVVFFVRQSHAHAVFDKSMSSTAGDFRHLTPLVLMNALKQAGTRVYEPMHRFNLELPADTLGPILPVLARLGAVPQTQEPRGSSYMLEGEIPAARVHELQQQLPALTCGEGVLEWAFDRYQAAHGTIPIRPRLDHNPLNRKEYLLRVGRRV